VFAVFVARVNAVICGLVERAETPKQQSSILLTVTTSYARRIETVAHTPACSIIIVDDI